MWCVSQNADFIHDFVASLMASQVSLEADYILDLLTVLQATMASEDDSSPTNPGPLTTIFTLPSSCQGLTVRSISIFFKPLSP